MRAWRTFPWLSHIHSRLFAATAASPSARRHWISAWERTRALAVRYHRAASLGAPAGIGMLDSLLGEIIAITEVLMAITVFAVALFGSKTLSERAFRLLRWSATAPNRQPPS